MPTLDRIGKAAVVNHHRDVPYWLIRGDGENSVGALGSCLLFDVFRPRRRTPFALRMPELLQQRPPQRRLMGWLLIL